MCLCLFLVFSFLWPLWWHNKVFWFASVSSLLEFGLCCLSLKKDDRSSHLCFLLRIGWDENKNERGWSQEPDVNIRKNNDKNLQVLFLSGLGPRTGVEEPPKQTISNWSWFAKYCIENLDTEKKYQFRLEWRKFVWECLKRSKYITSPQKSAESFLLAVWAHPNQSFSAKNQCPKNAETAISEASRGRKKKAERLNPMRS